MLGNVLIGLFLPFAGTALGSAMVFGMNELNIGLKKILTGFAAGVMVAATIWSLMLPSLDLSEGMGSFAFIPAVIGFSLGMMFLLLLDSTVPHMHLDETVEGAKSSLQKTTMMILAVTLHNIPEGMSVGVIYAAWASGESNITRTAALALAIGIAIQNFPEGAIISMPLHAIGMKKTRAFGCGVLSGLVEPLAGIVTILLSQFILPVLPYLLAFAGGAMMYVVIEELIPEMAEGEHTNLGPISFMVGFLLMMVLDVALG